MFSVLRHRNFALLWVGQFISFLGDWVLFAALPFYVYDLTGSTLATGAMFMVETLPRVALSSMAGVFVDRWDRRRTMIAADLARAGLILALLLVRSPDYLWALYAVALLESSISQFFGPAKTALAPLLVPESELLAANSLGAASEQLTRLIGPPLGGMLFAVIGLQSIVLVDSASYLISGLLIALIAAPRPVAPAPSADPAPARAGVWREWLAGLQLVRRDRRLAGLFLTMGPPMIGEGIILVLAVVYVKQVLHSDASVFGWLLSAQAVGGILGSMVIGRAGRALAPGRLIGLCGLADGLLLLLIFNIPVVWIDLGLFALGGVPVVGFFVSVTTLLQEQAPDRYRGRVFGALGTTTALLTLLGMGLAAGLSDRVGIVPMLDVMGALYLAGGLVALVTLSGEPRTAAPLSGLNEA
jgi:MFS family permease